MAHPRRITKNLQATDRQTSGKKRKSGSGITPRTAFIISRAPQKVRHTPRPVAVRRSEPPDGGATRPSFSPFFVRLPGLQDLFLFLFLPWKWATARGRAVSRGTFVFIFLFCSHVYFSAGQKRTKKIVSHEGKKSGVAPPAHRRI